MNAAGWTLVEGGVGEQQETFSERYPHCFSADDISTDPAWEYFISMAMYMEEAEEYLQWAEPSWETDGAYDNAYMSELPLFVNRYGNLCTNMWTDVDDGLARVLTAMEDGIFEPAADEYDDTTDYSDTSVFPNNL